MNIFEHGNYKEALKLWIRTHQRANRGIYKNLAEYLGVSPSVVSLVISGDRDFSEEQIFSVCEFLGLPELESQYLLTLLKIERAGTVKLKNYYMKHRDHLRKQSQQVANRIQKSRELTDAEKAEFYSSTMYSVVQCASSLERKVTFEFICDEFNLAPARARQILDFLLQSGLVIEKEGRYLPGTNSTHLDKNSPFVHKHLTNWRLKAIEASETRSEDDMFYSVNVSLSPEDFKKLREDVIQFIQKFLSVVKDSPAKEIAQLNIDLFRLKK